MASVTRKRKAIQARKAVKLTRIKSDVVTVASRRRNEKKAAVKAEG